MMVMMMRMIRMIERDAFPFAGLLLAVPPDPASASRCRECIADSAIVMTQERGTSARREK